MTNDSAFLPPDFHRRIWILRFGDQMGLDFLGRIRFELVQRLRSFAVKLDFNLRNKLATSLWTNPAKWIHSVFPWPRFVDDRFKFTGRQYSSWEGSRPFDRRAAGRVAARGWAEGFPDGVYELIYKIQRDKAALCYNNRPMRESMKDSKPPKDIWDREPEGPDLMPELMRIEEIKDPNKGLLEQPVPPLKT